MLGALTLSLVAIASVSSPDRPRVFHLSIGTGYAGLIFLCVTLLLGPWSLRRRGANPVSTDLRRDFGIWAALAASAHVGFGLQVHLSGAMLQYFFWPPEGGYTLPFRYDTTGAANYTGLASALVLLMLLALSNDLALRRLGSSRWKAFQRWSYGAFALMAVHGVLYQRLERRGPVLVFLFSAAIATVVGVRLRGRRAHHRSSDGSARGRTAAPHSS